MHGASWLAASLGVSPLVIGLKVVSFGTSMPELVVCLDAALRCSSDIAIGSVVGSNIANSNLILGASGLIALIPIHISLIKREIPVAIAASLTVYVLALDGGLLFAGLIVFTGVLVLVSRRERLTPSDERELEAAEGVTGTISRPRELGRLAAGIVVLIAGANLLVEGAVSIARALGVSELVIGLTLAAVGTSLPELATSLIAVLRRREAAIILAAYLVFILFTFSR